MILFPEAKPVKKETFEEYCVSGGYLSVRQNPMPNQILVEVTASGLRGRGGAGFPVGRKWKVAAETPATPRHVVCNAGEDEPGSFKDRTLIEYRPHLVLEGAILAALAIEAEEAHFYINENYNDGIERLTEAIEEARSAGYVGALKTSIHRAPTVYVAGEDSAALEVIEGKAAKPRQKPPYPAVAGIFGKPTVVNNVETLANIPFIMRHGASWFRGHGTAESPGTMIFCLGEEMNAPGAYELPLGTTLQHLYEDIGGGLRNGKALKAVLPGGPSCAFLTSDQLDISLDPESLKRAGTTLGCGVMRFYPEDTCMVEETLNIAKFFARESCGQCPACRMETGMLATMLDRIAQGKGDAALFNQFQKIIEFNRGKGYCALVNMPGPPILSAIRLFRDEFDEHARTGTCRRQHAEAK
jgi:NADH-quinone oxidoreductase subunit F